MFSKDELAKIVIKTVVVTTTAFVVRKSLNKIDRIRKKEKADKPVSKS